MKKIFINILFLMFITSCEWHNLGMLPKCHQKWFYSYYDNNEKKCKCEKWYIEKNNRCVRNFK